MKPRLELKIDSLSKMGAILSGLYLFSACIFNSMEGLSIITRLLALLILASYAVTFTFRPYITRNGIMKYYYYFVLWAIVTYPLSQYPVLAYERIYTQIQILLITFCITQLIRSEKQIKYTLNVFLCSTYIALMLNVSGFVHSIIYNLTASRPIRFAGTFGNSNGIALYSMLVCFSVVIVYFISKKSWLQYLHLSASLMISTGFIIQSGSRKGMIGFVLIFFLFGYSFYKSYSHIKWLRFLLIFVPLIMAGAVVNYFINSVFFSRIELMMSGEESSLLERIYLIDRAFEVWIMNSKNFIFGVGYGQFIYYNRLGLVSHNSFSESTVTTGLPGFLFYFTMYASFFFSILKLFKLKIENIDFVMKRTMFIIVIFTFLFFEVSAIIFRSRYMLPFLALLSTYLLITIENYRASKTTL